MCHLKVLRVQKISISIGNSFETAEAKWLRDLLSNSVKFFVLGCVKVTLLFSCI